MRVKQLVLKNFRNYSELAFVPHSGINYISGENAQGKTNLLEAVFFCAAGYSFRTPNTKELVYWGRDYCYAEAELEKINNDDRIKVQVTGDGKATFARDGKKCARSSLYRPAMAISYTAADTGVIKGPPSERRRWLDSEPGNLDLQYGYHLREYNKIINHRNTLLKREGGNKALGQLIAPWDEQMVRYGSKLIGARLSILKKIFPYIKKNYSEITSGSEDMTCSYLCSLPLERGAGEEEIRETYREALKKNYNNEIQRQQSLFGPHRDDVAFFVNSADIRKFGSGGQVKSAILALKTSVLDMFFDDFCEYPLVVLDDVLLELDHRRRLSLQRLIKEGIQCFITSNSPPPEFIKNRSRPYRVVRGKLLEEG